MNSGITLVVEGDEAVAQQLSTDVPAWFEDWEARLSRFRPTSELCELNRDPRGTVPVSPTMYEVLAAALRAAQLSEGLVTPTALDALERAGYDRSFEQLKAQPAPMAPRPPPVPSVDFRQISLRETDRTITRPVGLRLDLGGTAKGWIADQTIARIAGRAHALLDAGGDISVTGPRRNGAPWPVAIGSPFDPRAQLGILMLRGGGVATSGRDFRKWQVDGKWQHHVIDPRTGEPAETDLMSVTVIGPSAYEAEAVCRSVLIRGSRDGMAWLERLEGYAGVLALEDGTVQRSSRVAQYLLPG